MKVNGKEVEWEDPPKGDFLTDVKIKVLWRDEKTGAHFRLIKIPVGGLWELPHTHPEAGQWNFGTLGEIELPNGTRMTFGEDNCFFSFSPKGEKHGFGEGTKATKEVFGLQYFDGPSTKVFK